GTVDFRDARYLPVPGGPSSGLPEVWVLANALNTVLTGAYAVPVAPWQNLAAMVVLAGVGAAAVRRGPVWSGAAFLVGATGLLLVVAAQRIRAGDLVAVAAPVAALVLGAAGSFAVRWVTDTRHRRHVHRLFASYVPAAVARELMADPARALRAADGQRADITVFFCDLRGFTATAATLEPSQVRELLQVYYRHTAQHVLDQGGTVMQYVGDEVFAVFGAPLPQDDHAERAVAAAQRAQAANEAIDAELAAQGLPGVGYGIGLQSGPVVAAHVGELGQRRQYTVVGDTVNVGARLCSQAGRGEIVVSEDVLARMSHPPAGQPMGSVPLKGVERQLELVRLSSS
ncbi:MAG TPA: adenylate/guanylate cyclase domain-containing protein, partial [Nitriliruptorales bacterium]